MASARAWAALVLGVCLSSGAAPPAPPADQAALERRVMALSEQLRCVVCQNQTIADSQAALAVDLRQQVRQQLTEGKTDQAVLDFVVQRYGEFVLYRPPLRAATLLLWFGPALLLGAGLLTLFYRLRAQRRQGTAAAPAPAALARAASLLDQNRERP